MLIMMNDSITDNKKIPQEYLSNPEIMFSITSREANCGKVREKLTLTYKAIVRPVANYATSTHTYKTHPTIRPSPPRNYNILPIQIYKDIKTIQYITVTTS